MKRCSVPVWALTVFALALGCLLGLARSAGAQQPPGNVSGDIAEPETPDAATGLRDDPGLVSSWHLASGGATSGSSPRLRLQASFGQFTAGPAAGPSLNVNAGFWQEFTVFTCCSGRVGNIDLVGEYPQDVDSSDLGFMVEFLFPVPGAYDLPCQTEADLDRSGNGHPGSIDSTDLGLLVNYLFLNGYELPECP